MHKINPFNLYKGNTMKKLSIVMFTLLFSIKSLYAGDDIVEDEKISESIQYARDHIHDPHSFSFVDVVWKLGSDSLHDRYREQYLETMFQFAAQSAHLIIKKNAIDVLLEHRSYICMENFIELMFHLIRVYDDEKFKRDLAFRLLNISAPEYNLGDIFAQGQRNVQVVNIDGVKLLMDINPNSEFLPKDDLLYSEDQLRSILNLILNQSGIDKYVLVVTLLDYMCRVSSTGKMNYLSRNKDSVYQNCKNIFLDMIQNGEHFEFVTLRYAAFERLRKICNSMKDIHIKSELAHELYETAIIVRKDFLKHPLLLQSFDLFIDSYKNSWRDFIRIYYQKK